MASPSAQGSPDILAMGEKEGTEDEENAAALSNSTEMHEECEPIDIDSDSSEDDEHRVRGTDEGACQRQKKRERSQQPDDRGRSVLHVKRYKSWAEKLRERGIHEFDDPDKGRLQKGAQYLLTGKPLSAEDEEWRLKNTPRPRVKVTRTKQRRDRPACLSEVSRGDEVFVFQKKRALKGTVVHPSSDSEGDGEEHRLKYNKVAVKIRSRSGKYERFRRSKLRNRMIHLSNLPTGWEGTIRLCDTAAKKVSGRLHLQTPYDDQRCQMWPEELQQFLRRHNINKVERDAVEASNREALRTARLVWPWLFDEDDSDSSSGEDYDGDYCVVCGDGGTLIECAAKGCVESVHTACLEVAPAEKEQWYCQACRQEAFLLNRSVQTRVENGPGVQYIHRVFGKPQASWQPLKPRIHFQLPKMLAPPPEYGIGAICGSSGSGKSLILERRFGHKRELPAEWERDRAIIDLVHEDPAESLERLIAAAIESESDMLKPYHVLSEGQKMRVRVAKALDSGVILDEFASCLDYTVVHSLCRGVSRFVKEKQLSKVIVASCHPKVVEWLRPDWSYNTDTGEMRYYNADEWPARDQHAIDGALAAVRSKLNVEDRRPAASASAGDEVQMREVVDSEDEYRAKPVPPRRELSRSPQADGVQGAQKATAADGEVDSAGAKDEAQEQSVSSSEDGNRSPVTLKDLRARPRISPGVQFSPSALDIVMEVADPDVWEMFRTEHYKHGSDIKGAHVYVATLRKHQGTPVGMVAVRPQPGRTNSAATRKHNGWYRESRLAVLKVWQGLGIGCAISDAVAKAYKEAGCIYTSCFLHPCATPCTRCSAGFLSASTAMPSLPVLSCRRRLHKHRESSTLWKPTSTNMVGGRSQPTPRAEKVDRQPKFSYEFVGELGTSCNVDVHTIQSSSSSECEGYDDETEHLCEVDNGCDGDVDDEHSPASRILGGGREDDGDWDNGGDENDDDRDRREQPVDDDGGRKDDCVRWPPRSDQEHAIEPGGRDERGAGVGVSSPVECGDISSEDELSGRAPETGGGHILFVH